MGWGQWDVGGLLGHGWGHGDFGWGHGVMTTPWDGWPPYGVEDHHMGPVTTIWGQ